MGDFAELTSTVTGERNGSTIEHCDTWVLTNSFIEDGVWRKDVDACAYLNV